MQWLSRLSRYKKNWKQCDKSRKKERMKSKYSRRKSTCVTTRDAELPGFWMSWTERCKSGESVSQLPERTSITWKETASWQLPWSATWHLSRRNWDVNCSRNGLVGSQMQAFCTHRRWTSTRPSQIPLWLKSGLKMDCQMNLSVLRMQWSYNCHSSNQSWLIHRLRQTPGCANRYQT